MTNHYHVLVEIPDANLSKGMRQLNGVYTQRFNRAHGRTGHVFQGLYKAILAHKEAYLLELARYVVLNPVRARMVLRAADWPSSSYRAMIGAEPAPEWLETSEERGRGLPLAFLERRMCPTDAPARAKLRPIAQAAAWRGLRLTLEPNQYILGKPA